MRSATQRTLQTCAGAVLLVAGAFAVPHGWRAARAAALYYRARYGPSRGDTAAVLSSCERAHRLAPVNYRVAAYAASTAYAAADAASGEARRVLRQRAKGWCEAGLGLNPYLRELRLLQVRLMMVRDPAAAARTWERYVDWHYWDPFNHAVRVELHARAGNYAAATAALRLIEGFEEHARAAAVLRAAWARERTPPG